MHSKCLSKCLYTSCLIIKEYSSLLDRNGKGKKMEMKPLVVCTNTQTVTCLKASFDDDDDPSEEARRLPV